MDLHSIEGPVIMVLVSIITFFLHRLINELDKIKATMVAGFDATNKTLYLLEKELSARVASNSTRISILEEVNRIHFRSGEDRREDEMPTGQYIAMSIEKAKHGE